MREGDYYRSRIAVLKSCMSWQYGSHIDSLPIESSLPFNRYPMVVAGPSPTCRKIRELEKCLRLVEEKTYG
jgi:hypothetical protein